VPSISAPDEDQNKSYGFSNGSGCLFSEQQPPKPYGTSTGFTPNIAVSAEPSQRQRCAQLKNGNDLEAR